MWELIPDLVLKEGERNSACESHRLKVPGGWIIRTIAGHWRSGGGVAQTFVGDPNHKWELEQPKKSEENI